MELIKKYKNILLSVVIIAVAAVLYTVFIGKDGIDTSLLTSSRPSEAAAIVGEDLLVLLRTLRSIDLNEEFFNDPVFRSLEDFGQELVPEPIGRNNPFAPIGQEEGGTFVEEGVF